ncbi:platelet glycoprotein 4-like [Dermatophagoides farinae]|uniref:platelet glycoprotein 4-like n=1 Tax=Dermatophagoides farinae TaxID=6954 RepID=UPI003F5E94EA
MTKMANEIKSNDNNSNQRQQQRMAIILLIITMFGGFLYMKFTDFLVIALQSQLQINGDPNDFTKNWQDPPIPITIDAYIFSIDNPQEFASGHSRAKIREMGPYSYRLAIHKEIVSFEDDNRIVTFFDVQKFYFKNHESHGQLSDRVNVLNFPAYAMANMVRGMIASMPFSFGLNPIVFSLVSLLFLTHGESMIKQNLTAGQLLNGYPFRILDTIDRLAAPLRLFGIELPDTGMPDNKFGFLWTKNGTKNGPYQTYTGQDGTDLLRMVTFKGQYQLDFYDNDECNALNGTEGSTLGLNVHRDRYYYLFTHDLCRSLNVIYQQDTWVNGFHTYRFGPDRNAFAAPRKNPLNRCFCRHMDNENLCDGIFDLSKCLAGAPLAYSFPHFLYAHSDIRTNVENMRPSENRHRAYIDVDPITGSPFNGVDKIQINALLEPIPYLSGYSDVHSTILPLLWMQKSAKIDDKLSGELRLALYPIYAVYIIIYLLFFGGFSLLTIHIARWSYQSYKIRSNRIPPSRSSSTEPLYHQQQQQQSSSIQIDNQQQSIKMN